MRVNLGILGRIPKSKGPPSCFMRRKVHTVEIPQYFVCSYFDRCSVGAFIDVFAHVCHRRHRSTNPHVYMSLVLSADPWIARRGPLIRQEYTILSNGSPIARPSIPRKSVDVDCFWSESLGETIRSIAVYHACAFWAHRAEGAVRQRRRYSAQRAGSPSGPGSAAIRGSRGFGVGQNSDNVRSRMASLLELANIHHGDKRT